MTLYSIIAVDPDGYTRRFEIEANSKLEAESMAYTKKTPPCALWYERVVSVEKATERGTGKT